MDLITTLNRVAASTAGGMDAVELACLIAHNMDPDSPQVKQALEWMARSDQRITRREATWDTFHKYYCTGANKGVHSDCTDPAQCQFASPNGCGCTHPLRPRM